MLLLINGKFTMGKLKSFLFSISRCRSRYEAGNSLRWNNEEKNIMNRKHKQSWSTIPSISTRQTITSLLKPFNTKIKPQHVALKNLGTGLGQVAKCAGLNLLIGWISLHYITLVVRVNIVIYYILIDWVWGNSKFVVSETLTIYLW